MTQDAQTAPTFKFVLYEIRDGVAYVTLNRPEKLNAFHLPMYHEIRRAFEAAEHNDAVRVIVVRGAGRAFCSGRDFKYSADLQDEDAPAAWRREYKLFGPITWFNSKIVIAQVQGYALGGGGSLALLSDITIAAEGTKFGYPETRHGIASKTMIWPWTLGVRVAKEIVASGRMIAAEDALHLRLVNHVVPLDELSSHTEELATRIAHAPAGVPELIKRMVNWCYRDLGRLTSQDRQYDVDTAHWDAAGVEPSEWLLNAMRTRAAYFESNRRD